jgi:hypothetical protein
MSLIHLSEHSRSQPGRSARRVSFDRRELMLILNLYSQRVARGEWRDYAIDTLPGRAVFSIFRSSLEYPLYAIVKQPGGRKGDYSLFSGRERLAQGKTLEEIFVPLDQKMKLVKR